MRFQKVLYFGTYYNSISIFFVYAKFTDGNWILTHTGQYCNETISSISIETISERNSLSKCKTYCQTNNANRFYYYRNTDDNDGACRCCSASSVLRTISSSRYVYDVYTFSGNHIIYHPWQNIM